jgi:hypothetical protein
MFPGAVEAVAAFCGPRGHESAVAPAADVQPVRVGQTIAAEAGLRDWRPAAETLSNRVCDVRR